MHVVIVTTSFARFPGDAIDHLIMGVARPLVESGVEVTVVAPHAPGAARRETMEGVRVRRYIYAWPHRLERLAYGDGIPVTLSRNPAMWFQTPALVLAGAAEVLAATRRADLIHAFWTPNAVVSAPAALGRRLPLLLTVLGSDLRTMPRWLNRAAFRTATGVVCYTAETKEYLDRYSYPDPIFNISCIPDLRRLEADGPLEPALAEWCRQAGAVVTFVARLEAFKDPLGFIRAAPSVLRQHPGARFLVAGDGPLRRDAEDLVRRLGLSKAVWLTGQRADVGAILRASTVFVANSPVTNYGSASILEAMAMGLPVVLTDVGDPVGAFRQKDYVERVRPEDPEDLARGIGRVLADNARRRHLAAMAGQFLEDHGFTEAQMTRRHLEAYELLCRRGRSRRHP